MMHEMHNNGDWSHQQTEYLGDEPLYCEAPHNQDDIFYSGSEDEYYENPEARRLRIEAKALRFLAGERPFLLSAGLNGPFTKESGWTNPWRSRRAGRPRTSKVQTARTKHSTKADDTVQREEAIRSIEDVEESEDDAPAIRTGNDQADHGEPGNTQGTSLYPLPSPETTNSPSVVKSNLHMDVGTFNRVNHWRDTVQPKVMPKETFWVPENKDDDGSGSKKRPADTEWLRRNKTKKRMSGFPDSSMLVESPTQARRRRLPLASKSAPGSSLLEDDLAAGLNATSASFDTSRLPDPVDPTAKGPSKRRATPSWQQPRQQRSTQDHSAFEELPVPTLSPSRHGSNKLKRSIDEVCSQQDDSLRFRVKTSTVDDPKNVEADPGNGRCRTPPALESTDQKMVEPMTVATKVNILYQSQQDRSFRFRAKTKKLENRRTALRITGNSIEGTTLSLASPFTVEENPGPSAAPEAANDASEVRHEEERSVVMAQPVLEDSAMQDLTENVGTNVDGIGAASVHEEGAVDTTRNSTPSLPVKDDLRNSEDENMETDATRPANAPLCLGVESQAGVSEEVGSKAETCSQGHVLPHIDQSDPEWSTYINTPEVTRVTSLSESQRVKETEVEVAVPLNEPHPMVEEHVSDPDWSTYINTQELSPLQAETEPQRPNEEVVPTTAIPAGIDFIVEDGDCESNSEWSTCMSTQEVTRGLSQAKDDNAEEGGMAMEMEMETAKPGLTNSSASVIQEDDSDSDWTSYESTSSQLPTADNTADTSRTLGQTLNAADETDKVTGDSLDSIFGAYAQDEQASDEDDDTTMSAETEESQVESTEVSKQELEQSPAEVPGQLPKEANEEALVAELRQEPIAASEQQEFCAVGREQTHVPEPQEVSQPEKEQAQPQSSPSEPQRNQEMDQVQEHHANGECPSAKVPEQGPGLAENEPIGGPEPIFSDETTVSLEPSIAQSPWAKDDGFGVQNQRLSLITGKALRLSQLQSPWTAKEAGVAGRFSQIDAPSFPLLANGHGFTFATPQLLHQPKLGASGGEDATPSRQPTTPDLTRSNLPTPNFTMSIKSFSQFMSPSPTKKRTSLGGNRLSSTQSAARNPWAKSSFKKPNRHVSWAPLPGEAVDSAAINSDENKENETIYDEEDVSFFDAAGRKKGTYTIARPRAASPPPLSAVPAAELPDYDSKFAKHFEAMAKRKKTQGILRPRMASRLLPTGSQQVPSSPGLGAMAEAFIQASQTRKLQQQQHVDVDVSAEAQDLGFDDESLDNVGDGSLPIRGNELEEEVDEVSAVLDNLDKFLDDTWEMNGLQEEPTVERPQKDVRSFGSTGDPMKALEFNVWG